MPRISKLKGPNLYEVLGIPSLSSCETLTQKEITSAYRRTLLHHHPDKANTSAVAEQSLSKDIPAAAKYSVDTICLARNILISPSQRREYDQKLLNDKVLFEDNASTQPEYALLTPIAVEALDLDEMVYSDHTQTWTRPCRCGNTQAFEVSEQDLTEESTGEIGELVVGCGGCSLHVRIAFKAAEEEEEGTVPPAPEKHIKLN